MTLRKIEGFEFDGSPNIDKAIKKYYNPLLKVDSSLGSDDVTGIIEDGVFFSSNGRYSGYALNLTSDYDTINVDCPSCSSQAVSFGSNLKIPVYEVPLNTFGVVGFSVNFGSVPGDVVGMQTSSDNDGSVFFAIGGLHNDQTNLVLGIRASDNHLYLKAVDNPIDLYVSTSSLTGTYGERYRGFHNDNSAVIDSGFEIESSTWYSIEIKYKLSTSSTGQIIVYVDGTPVITTAANLDFTSAFRNAIYLCNMFSLVTNNPPNPSSTNCNFIFDDLYHLDDTGNINNDYIGNFRIRRSYPDVNYINEGTPSHTPYFAVQSDDDGDSYISIQSGQREVFEFADISDISSRIRGIQYNYTTYFENNANIRIIPLSEYGGVLHSGYVNQIPVSGGGYYYHSIPMESSLITGANWTRDEINNGYHGFTILS